MLLLSFLKQNLSGKRFSFSSRHQATYSGGRARPTWLSFGYAFFKAEFSIPEAIRSLRDATTFYRYKKFYDFLAVSIEEGNSFQKASPPILACGACSKHCSAANRCGGTIGEFNECTPKN